MYHFVASSVVLNRGRSQTNTYFFQDIVLRRILSFDSSMCFLIISQEQEYFKTCGLCCELISPVFRFRSFSAKTNDNLFEILEQLQYLAVSGKFLPYNKDQIYVFQGPLNPWKKNLLWKDKWANGQKKTTLLETGPEFVWPCHKAGVQ